MGCSVFVDGIQHIIDSLGMTSTIIESLSKVSQDNVRKSIGSCEIPLLDYLQTTSGFLHEWFLALSNVGLEGWARDQGQNQFIAWHTIVHKEVCQTLEGQEDPNGMW